MINYYLLTKPGIIFGNLLTVFAGFILASQGAVDFRLFFATLIGLALIMASACVFNNYIDRNVDKKMTRTKNRALANGKVSTQSAILFAIALGCLGGWTLYFFTNLLTLAIASTGFFVYVILYSLWKCRTAYGTAIGSIAGAVPPVVGYAAVTNRFDAGAMILFLMMVLWQMPHFFAIAIRHLEDYTAGSIPVLPVKKGIKTTKFRMLFYIIGFTLVALMLTLFEYTGYLFFTLVVLLGCAWLALCLKGFKRSNNDQRWARSMFQVSLIVITVLSLAIPFDVV